MLTGKLTDRRTVSQTDGQTKLIIGGVPLKTDMFPLHFYTFFYIIKVLKE
jgi:hypothetical protein